MSSSEGPRPLATVVTSSLSTVAGRILDQLSPTAWLPAAFLVADVALVLGFSSVGGAPDGRLQRMLDSVNALPFGVIAVIVGALVMTTTITQSFEFLAIRFLEGYWGSRAPAALIARIGIWRHSRRRAGLERLKTKVEADARSAALPLIQKHLRKKVLLRDAVTRRVRGDPWKDLPRSVRREADDYLDGTEWRFMAPPRLVHRLNAIETALLAFPDTDRMMPTRLGIALRTGEDRLAAGQPGEDLRGMVIRNLAIIDPVTLAEHDHYRNRLDMYSVLCLTAAALAPFNALVLLMAGGTPVLAAVGGLAAAVLSWVTYRGAITTAADYTNMLAQIETNLGDARR